MKRVLMLAPPLAGVLVLAGGAILKLGFAATVISAAFTVLALACGALIIRKKLEA
jgi:hypothetical protein